jgi:hypothetical protein
MEWNDDNIMYFRWITDCKNPFDDYVVFMMDLRGHFDYRIGWLLLYYRDCKSLAFQPIGGPQKNVGVLVRRHN